MPLEFIIARIRHHWRSLLGLTVALCLLTGFAAFYPLYSGVLSAAFVEGRINDAPPTDFQLSIRNPVEPIMPEVETALQDDLGNLYESYRQVARTTGVTCALDYPNPFNCFQIATYNDLDSLVTLTEGTLPQTRPDQETPVIEAVVMPQPARLTQTELGRTIPFGEGGSESMRVEVVGIIEPTMPDDVFWSTQNNVVRGIKTPVGIDYRDDLVLLVSPEAFNSYVVPLYRDILMYSWRIRVDTSVITADNLADLEARLLAFEQSYFQFHPDGSIGNSLLELVTEARGELDAATMPVLTFALVICGWLVCLIGYLTYLLFYAQAGEWQLLTERGIDLRQIARVQLGTVAGLVAFAVVCGPLVAYGLLLIAQNAGPVAPALDAAGRATFNVEVLLFAGAAGIIALLVTVGMVWAQFQLATEDSDDPTEHILPIQLLVDVGVFLLGFALLLRVYFINSDNLSDSIERLFREPVTFIDIIAQSGGTGDPLDLLGPVLLVVGIALFTLRLLPVMLRLLAQLPGGFLPLALRESRRMQRYGFPVFLLIITGLIGVTAFTLSHTYTASLWRTAYVANGGDARVNFPGTQTDVTAALGDLPDVVVPALDLTETNPTQITLLAVDPTSAAERYPEWSEALSLLIPENETALEGFPLPEATDALSIEVYVDNDDNQPTTLDLFVTVEDALGIGQRLTLQTDTPSTRGTFATYRAELPQPIQPPWRMTSINFASQAEANTDDEEESQVFEQTVLIDTLVALTADGGETVIEDFERTRLPEWQIPELQESGLVAVRTAALSHSGESSLRVRYEVEPGQAAPTVNTIPVNVPVRVEPIPILISRGLAEAWGQTYNNRDPLPTGFEETIVLPPGLGGLPVRLEISAIIEDFPTLVDGERFLIVPAERIWTRLNEEASPEDYYHWNTAFIFGDGRAVSAATQATLNDHDTVIYTVDRYQQQRRAPLDNVFFGMLYVGFLVTFATYSVVLIVDVTVRRDAAIWHTLYKLGMSPANIRLWHVVAYGVPLLIGIGWALMLGGGLTALLLPLLGVENQLVIPWSQYVALTLGVLVVVLIVIIFAQRNNPEETQ